jgi:hypothetical protein
VIDDDSGSAAFRDEYEALPASIKGDMTFKEWCWLPADQRATLETDMCQPEWID